MTSNPLYCGPFSARSMKHSFRGVCAGSPGWSQGDCKIPGVFSGFCVATRFDTVIQYCHLIDRTARSDLFPRKSPLARKRSRKFLRFIITYGGLDNDHKGRHYTPLRRLAEEFPQTFVLEKH